MLSIVIPARNEQFLPHTLKDITQKAAGDYEVFVALEGYWPTDVFEHPNVHYIHRSQKGMRSSINDAVRTSQGDVIMKIDAHCMVDKEFDVKMTRIMQRDWVVVPRRKRLDADNWAIQDVGKPDVDYEFIGYPGDSAVALGIKGQIWTQRALDRKHLLLDENMTFQGSCYAMSREHWEKIGGLSPEGYGEFVREAQEISLKTWLGGGRVMTNKFTWYAHLHKGKKYGRGYYLNKREVDSGNAYCDDYWFNNRWERRKHDLAWLIKRFAPVPTWPEDEKLWTP